MSSSPSSARATAAAATTKTTLRTTRRIPLDKITRSPPGAPFRCTIPPVLTEKEGRAVLRARFEAAGLTIEEDFALDDPPITLDGWDATRRVGYEFLTTEAGDRDEITWQALEALELRMGFG